jgi:hypothetical protein
MNDIEKRIKELLSKAVEHYSQDLMAAILILDSRYGGSFFTSTAIEPGMIVHSSAKIFVVDTLLLMAEHFVRENIATQPLKELVDHAKTAIFVLTLPKEVSEAFAFTEFNTSDLLRSEGGTKVKIIDDLLVQIDAICAAEKAKRASTVR